MAFLGNLCLGLFVGGILSIGLNFINDKNSLIAVGTYVIGATLGGSVLAFLQHMNREAGDAVYFYPVGLLLSLLWYYVQYSINNITQKKGLRVVYLLGWAHLLSIIAITVGAVGIAGYKVLQDL